MSTPNDGKSAIAEVERQLREQLAQVSRAHAEALTENSRLREENSQLVRQCGALCSDLNQARAYIAKTKHAGAWGLAIGAVGAFALARR